MTTKQNPEGVTYYMKKCRPLLIAILSVIALPAIAQPVHYDPNLTLWYDKPAISWEEALPLGNGKTGAMVFGGVTKERFQLNDNTLWSGYPLAGNNPNGPAILPQVRAAVTRGDYDSAAVLWKKMQGPYSARYLPLGDLSLSFTGRDSITSAYERHLDLNTATAGVQYTINGASYRRDAFISYPDKVMVIHLSAGKKGAIAFTAALSSRLRYQCKAIAGDYLVLTGKAPKFVANRDYEPKQVEYDDNPKGEGMTFEIHVKIIAKGGTRKQVNNTLVVAGADEADIYLSEATSFNGFDKSPGLQGKDPAIEAKANLQKALAKTYSVLKQRHIADYRALFARVNLALDTDTALIKLPTDRRLRNFAASPHDHQLQVLYYQYGRYLFIAASRPGSRPANLQGIWNDMVQPPWGSNYTTNINTEMNYWLAENTNLSECHQPLFDFLQELSVNGAQTAKVNYNIPAGWVAHHNSDLWAKTSPPGGYDWDPKGMPRWSCWPMGGAWMSTHLWQHYLFTGNTAFLQKEYPVMKGAAQFLLHWLVTDTATGWLVTNPSSSPENTIKIKGKEYQLSMATTMDMSIIRELFDEVIKAAQVLKTDITFRQQLIKAKEKLYPFHIGRYGQLQEWFKDWDDPNDKHRHISQLFGLYPGSQISPAATPQLAAAAKQSLLHRGDVSTGWSMAWKINWWARLQDGDHAYKILSDAFTYIDPTVAKEQMGGGGTYPNFFDAHPPFQIDGNFGATAGMTEMLLQSHDGSIQLLPALPTAWNTGTISGIKARGNFTVSIQWKEGKLAGATIYSGSGGLCRISTGQPVKITGVHTRPANAANPNTLNSTYGLPPYEKSPEATLLTLTVPKRYTIDFMTEKGKRYTVTPL